MRDCDGGIVLYVGTSELRVGDPSTGEVVLLDATKTGDIAELLAVGAPLIGDCVSVLEDDEQAIVVLKQRPQTVLQNVQLNGFTDGTHGCKVFAEPGSETGIVTLATEPIWVGNPTVITGNPPQFRLGGKGALTIGATAFGIDTNPVAQRAAQRFTFVHQSDQPPYGFFVVDDIDKRLRALAEEAAAEAARRQLVLEQQVAKQRADNPAYFVNPYTFVPFPEMTEEEVDNLRARPAGHDRLARDRFIGSITVHWKLDGPLMVHGTEHNGVWQFPRVQDEPVVLGSSLKGALRSMHETLTGSCLRVADPSFIPVYRQQMAVQDASWRMIRIDEVDDGFPTNVTVCDETRWVDQHKIHPVIPASALQTGDTVDLDGGAQLKHGRQEHAGTVASGTGWLLLLSHSQARRGNHPYNVAAGKLPETPNVYAVTEDAYDLYQNLVEGTDDLRRYPPGTAGQPTHENVHFPYGSNNPESKVGKRRIATRSLSAGDVLWGRIRGNNIVRLSRAVIWRTKGGGTLGERIPSYLHPCDNPETLCPSCRLFGSTAEARSNTRDDRGAEQLSYRGHVLPESVRFSAYESELRTMVMASPRPGSGHTYLNTILPPVQSDDTRPSFNWSNGDAGDSQLRQLRGRKWYWADSDPSRVTNAGNEQMQTTAECIVEGTANTTLRFENLNKAEIGGLLCALNPALILAPDAREGYNKAGQAAFVIGGGKPFGFGRLVADADIPMDVTVLSAEARYAGAYAETTTVEELVAAFKDSVPESVQATWPDLAAVLRKGHVNAASIEYPSLDFFKKISGSRRGGDEEFASDLGRPDPQGTASTHRPPRSAQQYWPRV